MPKYLMIVIGIIASVLLLNYFSPMQYWWDELWAKQYVVNLQLYGTYEVDTSKLREYENVKENTPFTYFVADSRDGVVAKQINFGLQDMVRIPDDLISRLKSESKNVDIIFAFGRKLKEVKCSTHGYYLPEDSLEITKVTFFEEYQDDIMYVYLAHADKKLSVSLHETYYIMEGTKKVRLESLNETKLGPSGQQGE